MKLSASLAVVVLPLAISGCALFQSPIVKTLTIEVADAMCFEAAGSLDLLEVQKACPSITADIIRRLLAAKSAGMSKDGVCKPAPVSVLCKPPMLYNSALQICMGDLGYKAAYVDSYGVTQ